MNSSHFSQTRMLLIENTIDRQLNGLETVLEPLHLLIY